MKIRTADGVDLLDLQEAPNLPTVQLFTRKGERVMGCINNLWAYRKCVPRGIRVSTLYSSRAAIPRKR